VFGGASVCACACVCVCGCVGCVSALRGCCHVWARAGFFVCPTCVPYLVTVLYCTRREVRGASDHWLCNVV
jgi:hypothetical protein